MVPWASPFTVLIGSTFKCRATICLFRDFKWITGCYGPSAFKTRTMGLRKDSFFVDGDNCSLLDNP